LEGGLLKVGVELDLVHRRHDRAFAQQPVEMLGHEVAHPDGAHLAVGEELLQRPIGVECAVAGRGECLMKDEQVERLDAERSRATAQKC
jgi:hypothetical protein